MNNVIMDSQILSSLMACPTLADFKFNKNLQPTGGKSNSLECGSLAHFIMEHYNKSLIKGDARDVAIAKGFDAGREYVRGYSPVNKFLLDETELGLVNTPEDSQTKPNRVGWKYVFETMEQWFKFWENDTWTPLEAEVVKRKLIYQDEDLQIIWKGKLDVTVDTPQGIYPKDVKTMSQRRPTLSLNNQFIGQCILMNTTGVIIEKIGWQKSLEPHEKFERVMVSYSADRMAEWCNEIVPYYARMLVAYTEADNFPRNFTHCENKYGTCPFMSVCESDRNMRDEVLEKEFKVGKAWDVVNEGD